MSKKTTRMRKADLAALKKEMAFKEATAASEADAEQASAASKAAAPIADATPRPSIDTDDLAAIASMSMDDIAALMDGQDLGAGPKVSDKVKGPITRLGRDNVFVELGAKSEGQLSREEVPDAKIGDVVTAYVLNADDTGIHLSMRLAGAAAELAIDEAYANGTAVEGVVHSRNRGGFEVRIGSIRAFCPISQMDRHVSDDESAYIGETHSFKVLENDDKIVVSRRAIIDADLEQRVEEFWRGVAEGQAYEGIVSSVTDFGVFVDVGGVDGLVPKRELSWDPGASFQRGQKVEVRVIGVNFEDRKLTLSAKDPGSSPWLLKVGTEFIEGGTYTGKVVGIEAFGFFIELSPGPQGLLHSSRSGGAKPSIGDAIDVRLTEIDHERHRLALANVDYEPSAADAPLPEAPVSGTVREVLKNGIVVELEDGRTGWLSARDVDLPAGTVLAQRFRRGRDVQARITDNGDGRGRVTLSQRSTAKEGANAWRQQKAKQQKGSGGFGTFGDLLSDWKK